MLVVIFIFLLYLHLLMFFIFLFFFSLLLNIISHPSVGYCRGFYTHFILSVQPIAEWFATLSFSTIPLSFCREHYGFEWAFFTHRRFLPYAPSPTFYLRLSRPLWEPVVFTWSLQGLILILETQTWPICLFDSQ